MTHSFSPITQQRLQGYHAFGLRFVLWLARLITLLGPACRSRRVHHWIRKLERFAEIFAFLEATRRVLPLQQRNQSYIRRSAPSGFRRIVKRNRLFFKSARIRVRGDFAARIKRLLAVFANPEQYVARFVNRLIHGIRGSRLHVVRPRAHTIDAHPLCAIAGVDTS